MKRVAQFLFVLSCLLLAGCHKGSDAVGKWTGSLASSTSSSVNNPLAGLAKASLELNADKTFSLQMVFSFEGTWEQSGNTVTLTPTKMGSLDLKSLGGQGGNEKPMVLTMSADGKSMTMQSNTGGKGDMTFTRDGS
ncbi:MAG TPA: hypothetical protein VHE55_07505 [Fimbriimonadaceae bacterium]|nr:hypothetical protein [Fimbriimonadaceae bacterium]